MVIQQFTDTEEAEEEELLFMFSGSRIQTEGWSWNKAYWCNIEWFFFKVQIGKRKLIVGWIYHPPRTNIDKSKECLSDILESINKEGKLFN